MSTIQPTDTDDSDYPVKRQSFLPLIICCLIFALAYPIAPEHEKPMLSMSFFSGIFLYFIYTKIFVALGMTTGEKIMMILLLSYMSEPLMLAMAPADRWKL